MKRIPRYEYDWERWAVVGEPYNGPIEASYASIGSTNQLSDKPRRRKRRIGFRPPQKRNHA